MQAFPKRPPGLSHPEAPRPPTPGAQPRKRRSRPVGALAIGVLAIGAGAAGVALFTDAN